MLFRTKDLEAIFAGRCTLAFRRWKKPTVRPGGTMRTALGMVGIDSVEAIEPDEVTEADAVAAGYKDRAGVIAMFDAQEGTCYRIRLHPAGPDPRDALRQAEPDAAELKTLAAKLQKLDKAASAPWTKQALELIGKHPGMVSTTLAESARMDRADFKLNVRKLKALGLTISLEVGYRLSPRGVACSRRSELFVRSDSSGRKFRFHASYLERVGLAKRPRRAYLPVTIDESRIDLRASAPYNHQMADSGSPQKSCGRRATLALIGITQANGRRKETNMHIAIRTTLQTGLIGKWVDRSNGCYRPQRM